MQKPMVFDELAFDARNQNINGHRYASASSALIRQTRESVLQSNPNRMPNTNAQMQSTSKPPPNKKPTLSVSHRQKSVIVEVEPNSVQSTDEPKRKRRLSQSSTASSRSPDRNDHKKRSESIANCHTKTNRSFEQPSPSKKKSPTIPSELHNTILQSPPKPSSSENRDFIANPRSKQVSATHSSAASKHSLDSLDATVSFEKSASRATTQIKKRPIQKQKTPTFTDDKSYAQFDPVADSREPNENDNQLMGKNPRSTSYSWSHKRPEQNTQRTDEFNNPMKTFENFEKLKPFNEQHTSHMETNDNVDEKKCKDSASKEKNKNVSASSPNNDLMFGTNQIYASSENNFGEDFDFDKNPSNLNDPFNTSYFAGPNAGGSEIDFTEPNPGASFNFNADENDAMGTTDVKKKTKLLFMKITIINRSIDSFTFMAYVFFFFSGDGARFTPI